MALAVVGAVAQPRGPAPPVQGGRTLHAERPAALQEEVERLDAEIARIRDRLAAEEGARRTALEEARRLEQELALARVESERSRARAAVEEQAWRREAARAQALAERLDRLAPLIAASARALHRSTPASPLRALLAGADGRGDALAGFMLRRDVDVAREAASARRAALRSASEAQRRRASLDRELADVARREAAAEDALARRERHVRSLAASLRGTRALLDEREQAQAELLGDLSPASRAERPARAGGPVVASPALPGLRPLRGRLRWPLERRTRILEAFGRAAGVRQGTRLERHGVTLEARDGEAILAVADGRVAFEEWYKAFGRTLVIDHGSGCLSVLAHASGFDVAPGEDVVAGQRVGSVGDTGSLDGARLYLQLQCDGEALDPAGWLAR